MITKIKISLFLKKLNYVIKRKKTNKMKKKGLDTWIWLRWPNTLGP